NSFIVANGSSGGGSKSYGTVYATRSGINIGAGTGSSNYTGALHSIRSVTLQSGVSVVYAPFLPCNPPDLITGIPSDTDPFITPVDSIPLDFTGQTILTAKSNTPGVSFLWTATKGGVIVTDNTQPTITVSALGTYTVKVSGDNLTCFATDSVIVGKVPNIIGAELLSIYRNYNANTPNSDLDSFFVTNDGYVTIDIICKVDTQIVIDLLTQPQYGLVLYYPPGPPYFGQRKYPSGLSKRTITGDFPKANLLLLNGLSAYLNFCRTYYRPATNAGAILSQGDTTIRSYLVRKGYHLDGKGIKVGIISDSYATKIDPSKIYSDPCANVNQTLNVNSWVADTGSKDVPKNVIVLQDHPLQLTDEGRAMAQIVHDIAPGAEIMFRTGFFTEGDLGLGMQQLAAAGCKVIIDDITFVTALMLKDGVAAKTVNDLKVQGVFHSTAAGNFANKSYEKTFNPVDATSIGFPGKKAHNFGTNNSAPDFFQKVMLRPGDHLFVFQWADLVFSNEELAGTQFDLDIFLCPGDKTDGTSLISFPRDNQFGDPIEFIPIRIPSNGPCDTVAKAYNILIVNNTLTGNPNRIKYIDFKGSFRAVEYNEGGSTIVGHANAEGTFTVGAVRFNHVPKHPLFPTSLPATTKPLIESFSSVGGTFVNGIQRFKPNAAGPDGVDVTVLMGQDFPPQALNNFPNFFGTSAAAPHVGALAALLIQARDSFLHQSTTPDQLRSLLLSTAVDMRPTGLVGYDFSAGAGLVNGDAAMRTFAAPEPFEIRLVKPTNIIPCQDPFTLTIVGENFNGNSKVYLVNGPNDTTKLTPTYISPGRDTIRVLITTCVGNPEIFVFTESTPGLFKLDGGLSNSIRLFDQEIVVQTNNTTKKYGQVTPIPSFTATLIDNGDSTIINPADYAQYGLVNPHLKVKPSYGIYTAVGSYPDTVYREFKFPDDTALTNHYRYIFKGGVLTINKMPLTVTPNGITQTQNQFIGNITFTYSFPSDQPDNAAALKDTAQKYHEAFLLANALAVVKDFKMAQTGGYVLSEADLANMSTMLTINALINSRKFKIVNNQLVPETDPNSLLSQYIVDIASQSIFDYKTSPDTAKFYEGYPGISKKALLGQTPLENNIAAVQVVNGQTTSLQPLINGTASPVLNAEGIVRLAPLVNGQYITMLDGQLATLNSSTNQLVPIANSPKIQYVNSESGIGRLAYLVNGQVVTLSIGSSVPLTNGGQLLITEANSYVKIPNLISGLHLTNAIGGTPTLQTLINGVGSPSLQPLINDSDIEVNNGVFVNGVTPTLQPLINGTIIALNRGTGLSTLSTLVNGVSATLQPLVNGVVGISSLSALVNSFQINLAVTNGVVTPTLQPLVNNGPGGGGTSANNNAVIVDETDVNPLTYNYLGNMFGINMITGLGPGVQYIVPGTLKNANFDITYVTGKATIIDSTCLITRSPFNNFGSTPNPKSPTTLWVNVEAKISGQLAKKGDYLLYTGGSITLNDIMATDPVTNTLITTKVLPDGMIIADAVPAPTTHYDAAKKLWITRIPIGFSSTADIFLSGGVIHSSDGFEKKKNNANSNTVLRGIFYS
ncbi:MAG TPA: S8 family serine peptidase, partial [Flavitalea sp.]|nr:S8 family serine peptidase [Flavitalea sp.]